MRFLFVDKLLSTETDNVVRGIKHVTSDDFYLTHDESGRVVFMPSLIGETLGQLAAWRVMASLDFKFRPVAGVVASAISHRSVPVGSSILLESVIESFDETAVQYRSVATVGKDTVFSIDGALGPMMPMADFIDEQIVKRQYDEIAPNDHGDPEGHSSQFEGENQPFFTPAASPIAFQFDKIIGFEPGESIWAVKNITLAAPYFADHFPLKPVLPMTVLLESKINLARLFLKHSQFSQSYRFRQMKKIKMNAFVHPGDVVHTQLRVKSHDDHDMVLTIRSDVMGKRVCVLEMILSARE